VTLSYFSDGVLAQVTVKTNISEDKKVLTIVIEESFEFFSISTF